MYSVPSMGLSKPAVQISASRSPRIVFKRSISGALRSSLRCSELCIKSNTVPLGYHLDQTSDLSRSKHNYRSYLTANFGSKLSITNQNPSSTIYNLSPSVEITIYNHLAAGQTSAATTALAAAMTANISLSNQIWSYFTLEACQRADFAAICLSYEKLVAPPRESYHFPSNQVPFLLSVDTLVAMATLFAGKNDWIKVQGILLYFKRFYLYLGHRRAFVDLRSLLVEAKSHSNCAYKDTLESFVQLACLFKSTIRGTDSKLYSLAKEKIFTNYRWRREAIRKNILADYSDLYCTALDKQQVAQAKKGGLEVFRPFLLHNTYSTTEHKQAPLVRGALKTSDLPNFYKCTHERVQFLMDLEGNADKIATLVNFVTQSHDSLHTFVFRLLCELGHFKAANLFLFAFLNGKKLKKAQFFIQREIFVCFFHFCKLKAEDSQLGQEIFDSCFQLMKLGSNSTNPKILASYIQIMLLLPKTTPLQIEPFVASEKGTIKVDENTHRRFTSIFGTAWNLKVVINNCK